MFTKESIAAKLATDQKWLERGILAIQKCQTPDEQDSQITKYDNGAGWNGRDAGFGGYLADFISRSKKPIGSILSGKYVGMAQRLMRKYAGQLARIANANLPVNSTPDYTQEEVDTTQQLVAVGDADESGVDLSDPATFGFNPDEWK